MTIYKIRIKFFYCLKILSEVISVHEKVELIGSMLTFAELTEVLLQ